MRRHFSVCVWGKQLCMDIHRLKICAVSLDMHMDFWHDNIYEMATTRNR